MEIIKQGAEAILYIDSFEGQKVLVKERIKKSYRIPEIDLKLRKLRTREEVKLLTEARKCRVATPQILSVDEKEFKIFMEYLGDKRVKEILNSSNEDKAKEMCFEIGKYLQKNLLM